MTNPKIEVDIGEILTRLDTKLDKLSEEIKADQKKILEEVNNLKLGQARIEGEIKAIDERLSGQIKALDTKIEQIDKRVANQEFTNRGVLIGLILALLGGAVKLFGWIPNP